MASRKDVQLCQAGIITWPRADKSPSSESATMANAHFTFTSDQGQERKSPRSMRACEANPPLLVQGKGDNGVDPLLTPFPKFLYFGSNLSSQLRLPFSKSGKAESVMRASLLAENKMTSAETYI
jgi:hypothetical protein